LLLEALPAYPIGSWPERIVDTTNVAGAMRDTTIAAMSAPLQRYQAELVHLADHVLVEMHGTDNNGITVHAVIAVQRVGGKVGAFLLDERFEE